MSFKVFHYQLWKDKETGAYFARFNGTTVEVSKEVYYELMSHENADRYAEKRDMTRLSKNDVSGAVGDVADYVVNNMAFKEMLDSFDPKDRIIIMQFLTGNMTAPEIEATYGIPHSTVNWRGKKLLEKLKKVYAELAKKGF